MRVLSPKPRGERNKRSPESGRTHEFTPPGGGEVHDIEIDRGLLGTERRVELQVEGPKEEGKKARRGGLRSLDKKSRSPLRDRSQFL